jgi:RNA polymerase sigma-70 factor, ECF subfamily
VAISTSLGALDSTSAGLSSAQGGAETDEAALVGRLRAGENAAFDELVMLAGGRMLAVARRMMGSEADAQDAVQDAFLSAFKSLGRFDGRSQLTTWLHRITVNACLMKLRSKSRRPETSIEGLLPTFVADGHQTRSTRAWNPDPSGGIQRAEVRDLVRAKINELPEQYRVVLVLRDIEELSTEETAQVLEMTVHAVKTRLHRARQALRTLLEPHFVNPEAS